MGPGSYWNRAICVSSRLDHLAAFPQVVAQRLFAIDILARLAAPNRYQCVPVVGRCCCDRVDVLVVQQFADVGIDVHLLVQVFGFLLSTSQHAAIRVAQCDYSDAGQFAEQSYV